MSAGDFLIRRNALDSSTVLPTPGGTIDTAWDTEEYSDGTAATYNAGVFTLTNTAPYLIIYSDRYTTTDTTNNERIEGQSRIRMNGSDLIEGASEGYIRKSSGQQTMVMNGVAIYQATAGDTFTTRSYRGDNSTSGTVNREAAYGGVQIFELDSADDYADYTTSTTNTISSTESDIANWSNVLEETGFSRATNDVTISTAGRYLMVFSSATSETATARIGARVFLETSAGTEITGLQGYSHMRGSDGNQNGAISFGGIIDVPTNTTYTLRGDADSGSMTLDSAAHWQWWKLPSGNETAMMEATTGSMNGNQLDFTWDTLPYIDTAAFTATAGTDNILVDSNAHLLMFWNQGKTIVDSVQRAYPTGTPAVNGNVINYAQSGAYHRNSSSIGTFMTHGGSSMLHSIPAASSISLRNGVLGASGTIDTERGHFSLINLEGLYKTYTYTLPVSLTDVDTDEIVTNSQLNVVISGAEFGAIQGAGTVELVQFSNYTGSIVTQTIDSWSDTSIQIDIVTGALADTNCFLFVTTDTAEQVFIALQVGTPPETYQEAIGAITPTADHYWPFQNSYIDDIGSASANSSNNGTVFSTSILLVKGDTHSLELDTINDFCSPSDQGDMNTSSTTTHRYMGGWMQLDSVLQSLSVIWEEGAQVNNYALLCGFGNSLMWQFADDGGDYVQAYQDIKLTPGRPYHVMMEFKSATFEDSICGCYLDGIKQSLTNGNPWEVNSFPSHSGNISWGHENTENLQTGDSRGVDNVDIAFASPANCNYAHWYSWNDTNPIADVRTIMFAKGALANQTIGSNTTLNMQTAIDALADSVLPDWPCGIEIGNATEGSFSLTLDNITFNSRCSMPIRYIGVSTLTVVLSNGSDLTESLCEAPYGGTIVFERPATFTVEGLINGCEIRLYDDLGTNAFGDELAGIETLVGTTFQYSHAGTTNNIIVQMIATGYEEVNQSFQLLSSDQTLTLDPISEENV